MIPDPTSKPGVRRADGTGDLSPAPTAPVTDAGAGAGAGAGTAGRADTVAGVDQLLAPLFGRYGAQADILLDLRQHLIERNQPAGCVRLYYQLLAQVPAWRHGELTALRDHLEHFIRLQIVLERSRERFLTCLGLQRTATFNDYCQLIMREAARQYHDSPELELSFDWSAD